MPKSKELFELARQSDEILGPPCSKCGMPTTRVAVELVGTEPVNVFQCDGCNKLAAKSEGPQNLQLRARY